MKLQVRFLGRMVDVELHRLSQNQWSVTGTYGGEKIEFAAPGKGPALHGWKMAAAGRVIAANRVTFNGPPDDRAGVGQVREISDRTKR